VTYHTRSCAWGGGQVQKNLTLYLLFEHQQVFDGNLIDDLFELTNPGGTTCLPRAQHGNPGFHIGALLDRLQVCGHAPAHARGADLWAQDQAWL